MIATINSWVNGLVWGPPMLVLLFGTGIILTIVLKFTTWRGLGSSFRLLKENKIEGKGVPPRAALFTALAATIGTGNIAGVATAIVAGGPGAVFYMWLIALFGMATKYAEAYCAVKFRQDDGDGGHHGGPMYYLRDGVGKISPTFGKVLGTAFALFGAIAAFGIGNGTQSNSIASVLKSSFSIPTLVSGLIVAVLVAMVIIGGIKRIATVADKLVPSMAILYVVGGIIVLIIFANRIPAAFAQIFSGAFTAKAAVGGGIGAAIRYGFARGVFSNEAGLGSAAIAHATAATKNPLSQARIAVLGVFFDTIIICTFTALVILVGGVLAVDGPKGATLTSASFAAALPAGDKLVAVALTLFAFTTILGWSYYGEQCVSYLFKGEKRAVILGYRLLFVLMILLTAGVRLELIWNLSDTFNGLMALPNLIGLLVLIPVISRSISKEKQIVLP